MGKEKLIVVKIGGNIINNNAILEKVLKDFANKDSLKILVHGGGKRATALSSKLGIKTTLIEGRRVTDAATLEVATMVYAGLLNKMIVARLQAINCNAIGLSGADLNSIKSHKRSSKDIDYGFVGDIDTVGVKNITTLLTARFTPVFCAITHDKNGQLLNTNADSVAANLAIALSTKYDVTLILCFEKEGVLLDANDDDSMLRTISHEEFETYKRTGVVYEGMIPKLEGAFAALNKGVSNVHIAGTTALSEKSIGGTRLVINEVL